MFRTKLIEHRAYYNLRHKLFIYSLLVATTIGLASNIIIPKYLSRTSYIAGMLAIIIISIIVIRKQYRLQKGIDNIIRNKKIEIHQQTIRIINSDKSIVQEYTIKPHSIIKVKDSYEMPDAHLKSILNEFSGKSIENYIIYKSDKTEVRLDFIIDSFYMIEQLKKVITNWKVTGIKVESIN